ncbi:hypothetical protein [Bacillus cereus group sp. BfR-BA-01323]|nr:hypothetical protein [Bacillus cereus]
MICIKKNNSFIYYLVPIAMGKGIREELLEHRKNIITQIKE